MIKIEKSKNEYYSNLKEEIIMEKFGVKFQKIISVFLCLSLLIIGSGFHVSISKAESQPSYLSLTINMIDKNGDPMEFDDLLYLQYSFGYTSEVGNQGSGSTSQAIVLSGSGVKGTYTWEGKVREKIKENSRIYLRGSTRKTGTFYSIESPIYKENEKNYSFTVKVAKHDGTEDWKSAALFAESDLREYGYISRFQHETKRQNSYTIWAGGKARTLQNGLSEKSSTVQFLLREIFDPIGAGDVYMNSTKSRQIVWIATRDNKCPTSSKQKSDTSVVKVSKGKVTAVAPGVAYVWACRVSPSDKNLVQVDETASVRITVHNAPSRISLTDAPDSLTPISKLDIGVGERKPIYIKTESKNGEPSNNINYYIRVTEGIKYIAVNDEESTDDLDFLPSVTTTKDKFYIKALNYDTSKKKPVKAKIVVSNIESGREVTLNVTVNNGIVKVANESDIDKLIFTYDYAPQTTIVDSEQIARYTSTSAIENIIVAEGMRNPFANEPTTDTPKVFAASGARPTIDQIIKDGKISFSANKSNYVTVKYNKKGNYITIKTKNKKKIAQESGYIIAAYNADSNGNGILMIPYEIN